MNISEFEITTSNDLFTLLKKWLKINVSRNRDLMNISGFKITTTNDLFVLLYKKLVKINVFGTLTTTGVFVFLLNLYLLHRLSLFRLHIKHC